MTGAEPKGEWRYHHCERMAELGIGRFALHYSGHFERFGWALEFEHFTDAVTSVAYEVDNLAFCPWCGRALTTCEENR